MIRRYISERLGFAVSDRVSRFDAANCAILVDYPLIIELDTAINRATFLIGRVEGFAADNSMGLGR